MILSIFFLCFCVVIIDSRSIPKAAFKSDVIVTHWPTEKSETDTSNVAVHNVTEDEEPGWMRKQLLKFGKVASKIGNAMGSHATKISAAVEKICEVVKTILPFLTAVCHVGQFQFCAATQEAPDQVAQAVNSGTIDLDQLDR